MRNLAPLLCALSLLGGPAFAEDAPPPKTVLTLPDALDRALQVNLGVEIARREVAASEDDRRIKLSYLYPRIGFGADLTRNSTSVAFGSPPDQTTILPQDDWSTRLLLTQPVFRGLREKRALDQAARTIEATRDSLREAEEAVLLRVASSFLLVAEADGQIEVDEKGMELARRRRDEAQAFYEAGETTRVDVLRAETAIKESERRIVLARQIREEAAGRLRVDLLLEGDFEVAPPSGLAEPLPEAGKLLEIAEATRPEILRAGEEAEIARLEVLKQRGALWPTVQANAGWVWQKTPFPTDEYAYGSLSIIVPIFQGGEVGARVAQAREREQQANLALQEVRSSVREEVRTALWNVESTRTNLRLTEEQLAAAEAEYRQVAELYRSQEATSLDADSSENSLLEARRAFVTARLRVTFAELRAWYAAGALKTAIRKEGTP